MTTKQVMFWGRELKTRMVLTYRQCRAFAKHRKFMMKLLSAFYLRIKVSERNFGFIQNCDNLNYSFNQSLPKTVNWKL